MALPFKSLVPRSYCRYSSVVQVICGAVFAVGTSAHAGEPALPAGELIRRAVNHEVKAADDPQAYMFRSRKQTPRGSLTRLYVQTSQAMVGLSIAVDDKPLSAEQRQAEEARLQRLVNNEEELRKKRRQEQENADRVRRIIKALPDAFLYEYDGVENARPGVGHNHDPLTRLKFRPNPDYDPPSRVEQVLTGMQGTVLVDAKRERLAQIDGTLFKDVSFGWGILGHLDKGSEVIVEQANVGNGDWQITRLRLRITGKVLLFKGINIDSTEVYSDFQKVSNKLTFGEGLELARKQEKLRAENEGK
jgi:hypothetical protein